MLTVIEDHVVRKVIMYGRVIKEDMGSLCKGEFSSWTCFYVLKVLLD